jgi:hypothetical protein
MISRDEVEKAIKSTENRGYVQDATLLRTAFDEREKEIRVYERMVELIKVYPFSVQLSYETLVNNALELARKEIG